MTKIRWRPISWPMLPWYHALRFLLAEACKVWWNESWPTHGQISFIWPRPLSIPMLRWTTAHKHFLS